MISATMHVGLSTIADLRKAGRISSQEIVAIDAYMRDPAVGPYRFASGYSLDIAAIVALMIPFGGREPRRSAGEGVPNRYRRGCYGGSADPGVMLGRSVSADTRVLI